MHSQKPIPTHPEIQLQIYSIIPAQTTCAGYLDFTGIWDKSKQTALFVMERGCPSVTEFAVQPSKTWHGVLGWGAHSSEGQEGAVATALLWEVGTHSGGDTGKQHPVRHCNIANSVARIV